VEPLTRGLPPPDLHSLCPLSSAEFVEPPPPKKFLAKRKFLDSPLLAFALQLRKKHGNPSVRVAKYKNNEQYNTTQKKNSNTERYDVTEQQRTQNTQQRKLSITGK
jgi:hypothetical protein